MRSMEIETFEYVNFVYPIALFLIACLKWVVQASTLQFLPLSNSSDGQLLHFAETFPSEQLRQCDTLQTQTQIVHIFLILQICHKSKKTHHYMRHLTSLISFFQ